MRRRGFVSDALAIFGRGTPRRVVAAPHNRVAPLSILHSWLSTWTGIGHVIGGMHRQGYDVQLTQYDERGWRATFYVTGMEHSATSASASAWGETPWRAVQRAAWVALTMPESRPGR